VPDRRGEVWRAPVVGRRPRRAGGCPCACRRWRERAASSRSTGCIDAVNGGGPCAPAGRQSSSAFPQVTVSNTRPPRLPTCSSRHPTVWPCARAGQVTSGRRPLAMDGGLRVFRLLHARFPQVRRSHRASDFTRDERPARRWSGDHGEAAVARGVLLDTSADLAARRIDPRLLSSVTWRQRGPPWSPGDSPGGGAE
jgi:hypothetical protein